MKGTERLTVAGHRVIVVVPLQDPGEPAPLFGDRVMHPSPQLGLDRVQLRAHLLLARDPFEHEPPAPVLRTDMRKAEKPNPAPRGAMRKEMTDINISSVPAGMPVPG